MSVPVRITSFIGGEVSPSIQARIDLNRYASVLKTCKNFFVMREGGVRNRPGTKFLLKRWDIGTQSPLLVPAPTTNQVRVLPFAFSDDQSYVIAVGHRHANIIKGGSVLLDPSGEHNGLDNASTLTDTARDTSGSPWVADSLIGYTIRNVTSGASAVITNNTTTQVMGTLAGGTRQDWDIGDVYVIEAPYFISTPWDDVDLPDLQYVQVADVMTIVHRDYAIRELVRYTDAWTSQELFKVQTWAVGDRPATPTNAPTAGTPAASGGPAKDWQWVYTFVDEDGRESLPSPSLTIVGCALATSGVPAILEADKPSGWPTGWSHLNFYRGLSGVYGYVGQTKITNAGNTKMKFTDEGYQPAYSEGPPSNQNPFASTGDRPGSVAFFQQRLMFGGTANAPDTVFGSRTGQYKNFDKSFPVNDADALEFAVAQQKLNEIRAMYGSSVLSILTSSNEFILRGAPGEPLTPTSVDSRADTAVGSSRVMPVQVNDSVVFVAARSAGIIDLRYSFESDGYKTSDLSVFARHLFEGYTIKDIAYAQDPYSIVLAVRSDGVLLALTYLPDQEVVAWSRHETDGEFESVCVVTEGTEAVPYVAVKRTVSGVVQRYVERMQSRVITDVADSWFVDSGLEYNGTKAGTITISGSGSATVRASSHDDGTSPWTDQTKAYDSSTSTYAIGDTTRRGLDKAITFSFSDAGVVGSMKGRFDLANSGSMPVDCYYSTDGGALWVQFASVIAARAYVTTPVLYNVSTSQFRMRAIARSGGDPLNPGTDAKLYDVDYIDYDSASIGPGVEATLTASSSVFTADDVGDEIWINCDSGCVKFEIVGYTSGTQVTGLSVGAVPGAVVGTPQSPWSIARSTFDGLGHLEGHLVSMFADGNDMGDATVTGGTVAMESPGVIVRIGLPYSADLEPPDLASQQEPVKTKPKSISKVYLDVELSRGFKVGPDANRLSEWKQRGIADNYGTIPLTTAVAEVPVQSTWRTTGSVFVRQDRPLPLSILALTPEWAIGD